jgi:hypothetical protein
MRFKQGVSAEVFTFGVDLRRRGPDGGLPTG